jgi:hypothetical protein
VAIGKTYARANMFLVSVIRTCERSSQWLRETIAAEQHFIFIGGSQISERHHQC